MKAMKPLNLNLEGSGENGGVETKEVDIDDPLSATGTMLANADLAKKIYKLGGYYPGRVIMMNPRSNLLTDITCRTLNPLIEKSTILRFVDLRRMPSARRALRPSSTPRGRTGASCT